MLKIIWKGPVFNPTGISTASREIVKALVKAGCKIQCSDIWNNAYEFNEGLEFLNKPINSNQKDIITIFSDYPSWWSYGFGKLIGHPIHEGTRIFPEWARYINQTDKIFVASEANKNLFRWNDVVVPIEVINYGTNPEIYKPKETEKDDNFIFLSINSWTGEEGDRKGTDLLIKAFDKEFKPEEKVKLLLKIGTFWQKDRDYGQCITNILGHQNKNILWNSKYIPENKLVEHYQQADCFVAPTRGEGFGMTLINALACGLPLIVTKDVNSGHMDFCKGRESVLWIDAPEVEQGDPRFYVQGNMLAKPDLDSLKKQMRYAFENRDKLLKKAKKDSDFIRKHFTWDITAQKLIKYLNEPIKKY